MRTSPTLLLAIASCLGTIRAQTDILVPNVRVRPFPDRPTDPSGPIRSPVAFDYDGDHRMDVGFVRGGSLMVAVHPEIRATYRVFTDPSGLPITGITRLQTAPAGMDVLLAVGGGQTRLIQWDNGEFRVIPRTRWPGATQIDSVERDQFRWIVGYDPTAEQVLLGSWGLGPTGVVLDAAFDCPGVLEVTLADWFDDGIMEAIARTADGVFVFRFGVPGHVASIVPTTPSALGSIVRAERRGLGSTEFPTRPDQIAYLARNSTLAEWEIITATSAATQHMPLNFGELDIPTDASAVSLSASDIDGDGYEDLLYNQNSTSVLALFPARGDQVGFLRAACEKIMVGEQTVASDAPAALFVNMNGGDPAMGTDRPDIVLLDGDAVRNRLSLMTGLLNAPRVPLGALLQEPEDDGDGADYEDLLRNSTGGITPPAANEGAVEFLDSDPQSTDLRLSMRIAIPSNFPDADTISITPYTQHFDLETSEPTTEMEKSGNTVDFSVDGLAEVQGAFELELTLDLGPSGLQALTPNRIDYLELSFSRSEGSQTFVSSTYLYAIMVSEKAGDSDSIVARLRGIFDIGTETPAVQQPYELDVDISVPGRRVSIIRVRRVRPPWEVPN